jgi:pimeloyl-ACP methyl ester carboxylesterase
VNQTSRTIHLEDGRDLEFAEYGDPNGLPVLFFHGFLGSHYQASWAGTAARQQGVRLVAFNRPGVGRSSPACYPSVAGVAEDVRQLLKALALTEVALLAVSGGCPYALACACRLPERVRLVGVVSGLGPFEEGLLAHLPRAARLTLLLSRHCPGMARWLLDRQVQRFLRGTREYSPDLVGAAGEADQSAVLDPEVRRVLQADLEEVLVRGGGARTLVEEMRLFFRWGFRLAELPPTTPVLFWHGTDDVLVPASMARHMAAHICESEVNFIPGGHFLGVQIAAEVASQLARAWQSAPSARQCQTAGSLNSERGQRAPVLRPAPALAALPA